MSVQGALTREKGRSLPQGDGFQPIGQGRNGNNP